MTHRKRKSYEGSLLCGTFRLEATWKLVMTPKLPGSMLYWEVTGPARRRREVGRRRGEVGKRRVCRRSCIMAYS